MQKEKRCPYCKSFCRVREIQDFKTDEDLTKKLHNVEFFCGTTLLMVTHDFKVKAEYNRNCWGVKTK